MLSRTWSSGSYSYLTSYLYENTAWGDLLTSYKGQKLAYEGQTYVSTTSVTGTPKSGNPISYYNGTRWTMGWQGANQLISASSSGKSLSFTYDVNGLRTSKTYNGTKYQYAYAGDRLLWQSWSGNEMFFFYDEQGAPFAFRHVSSSGTVTVGYYFLNGQGDVVQIENASGTVLATYSYDPWGKPISSTGTFASINPLRYRGYYYDTETGFYYLQSRYYDPAISRFINADSYAATGGLLGYNMFAYCENDPVNALDSSGSYPIEVGDNPDRRPAAAPKSILSKDSHDANRRPNTGEPGSTWKAPNGDWRKYGPDGKQQQDYDHDDHGHPELHPHDENGGHYHDWLNGVRGPAHLISWETVGGVLLVTVCVGGVVIVAADDLIGIGIIDDFLFAPLGAGISEGLALIF